MVVSIEWFQILPQEMVVQPNIHFQLVVSGSRYILLSEWWPEARTFRDNIHSKEMYPKNVIIPSIKKRACLLFRFLNPYMKRNSKKPKPVSKTRISQPQQPPQFHFRKKKTLPLGVEVVSLLWKTTSNSWELKKLHRHRGRHFSSRKVGSRRCGQKCGRDPFALADSCHGAFSEFVVITERNKMELMQLLNHCLF